MPASPASESSTVTVVVVTWNGAHLLPWCLDPLLTQETPGFVVDVVVVDNGSTDDTMVTLAAYPGIRVIALDTNTGFAAAANRGISSSSASFVVLLNNDAQVQPGFLAALLAPFEGPDADRLAAVTARIMLADTYRRLADGEVAEGALVGFDGSRWVRSPDGHELLNSTGNEVTRSGNGRDRDWLARADSVAAADVFGFCGGAAALRRASLLDVGLFEERLFLYYEDTDLSWRLRRRGWRIEYADDAHVRHQHAASSGTSSDFFARHNERNRLVVAVRNAPAGVVLRAFVRTFGRMIVRGRRHWSVAGEVLAHLPSAMRARRAINRGATVGRRDVARYLVPDGPP